MISFNCVQCGKKFLTPEHLAGRKGKCARCGTVYEIPQPGAPMEDATPSSATGEFVAYREPKEEPPGSKEEPPEPKEPLPWPREELPWFQAEAPEPETPKIRFACEQCGRKFAMSLRLVGNAGSCPDCGTMFLVPTHSDGEAPPPPPPPPPPARTSRPTATVPAPQVTAHPTPTRTSKPTEAVRAPQFLATATAQRTSKPTATMPAAPPPLSSLVEVRSDKPLLSSSGSAPPAQGGAKGLVAALVLCAIAGGGAFWAWKSTGPTPTTGGTAVAGGEAGAAEPAPLPPPSKPTPPPVAHTSPPVEEPVLTPPDEGPPTEVEEPHFVEPTPPPVDPAQPPTPIDPASTAPLVPDAGQVAAAIADFERQRGYVKDCPDAVQQARALDALSCVVVDARAIEILGELLASPAELTAVRKRAAEMLGDSRSTEAVPALQAGFETCRAEAEVARVVILSLGRIDSAASVKALSAVARGWMKATDEERDHMYASVAILSISQMRRRESVDALLGFWAGLVAAKPADTSGLSDAGWKRESHRTALESTTQTSLCTLTGEAFSDYGQWKAWWEEKRGAYK